MTDIQSTSNVAGVGLNAAGLSEAHSNNAVEKTGLDNAAAKQSEAKSLPLEERVSVSEEASAKAALELKAAKYARMAQRLEEPLDHQKVEHFKNLVASGQVGNYLNSLDNGQLANALLTGPAAKFLTS